jgi:hypothetical protein
MYHAGCVVHGFLSSRGLSCAMSGGEAGHVRFLARGNILTFSWRLRHGRSAHEPLEVLPTDKPGLSQLDCWKPSRTCIRRDCLPCQS